MMLLLILVKIPSKFIFLNKHLIINLVIFLLGVTTAQADIVQRWQDNHGQWHYGDQATTIGRKTQPVIIKNPISVIKNDQPSPQNQISSEKNATTKTKKHSRSARTSDTTSAKTLHKQQCETLREQVYRQPVSGKASQVRQNLVRQYEQNCIAGNYYGD